MLAQGGQVSRSPLTSAASYSIAEPVMLPGYSSNIVEEDLLIVSSGIIGATALWGSGVTAVDYSIEDAGMAGGGSGAPVLNMDGHLVGINSHVDSEGPFAYAEYSHIGP